MSEYDNSVQPATDDQTTPTIHTTMAKNTATPFGSQTPAKHWLRSWNWLPKFQMTTAAVVAVN
jgi:hypothetical protein